MSFTSYSVDNDNTFKEWLREAAAVSQDLRVPFGLILRDFYRSEAAIFKLKGPGQYPPFKHSVTASSLGGKGNEYGRRRTTVTTVLSPYQKWKLEKFKFDYPLLVRTGKLANSLLGPNNPGSISSITKLSLAFGTSVPYGVYHQSDEPRKKIPLRKFLFIGPEASQFANSDQMGRLTRWLGYIQDHILQQIKKGGG